MARRVDGKAAPGLKIADPRGSHLEEAIWVTAHTRGGGKGSKRRKSAEGAEGAEGSAAAPLEFKVGDDVEAKMRGITYGYFEGHITKANDDGTFVVHFDDGSDHVDPKVPKTKMRHALRPVSPC